MSFISFLFFFCARIEEPSPRVLWEVFRATFFLTSIGVEGLYRLYLYICVHPHVVVIRHRIVTVMVRMIRVVHEDYCS